MKQQFLDEEYNWVLKDYKELKEKPLNEQQRKNEASNILNITHWNYLSLYFLT